MEQHFQIKSSINNLHIIEDAIDKITSQAGISRENYGKVLVATLEAVNNAILHGNKADSSKIVDVVISFTDAELKVKVSDEGKGFLPDKVPDPTKPENILSVNGRGVFLMRRLADNIKFNKEGNSVEMTFNTRESCNAELL